MWPFSHRFSTAHRDLHHQSLQEVHHRHCPKPSIDGYNTTARRLHDSSTMINRRIVLLILAAVVGSTSAISPITPTVSTTKRSSLNAPWGVEKVARGGGGDVGSRFGSTLDVIISKLFPAGFCWQLASMLTKSDASSAKFALTTGAGEAAGVLGGHVLYSLIKGGYDKSVLESALLLATGTLCSGSSWQPVVNTLQSMDLPFYAGKLHTCINVFWHYLNIILLLHNQF